MAVGTPVDRAPGAVGTFGADADNLSVREIDLTTARNKERTEFGASNVLWIVRASSPLANVDIRFNEQNDAINFRRGQSLEGIVFSRAYISNAAQAGETITLLTVRDFQRRISISSDNAPVAVPSLYTSTQFLLAQNVRQLVSPGNPKKRKIIIECIDTNSFINIGNSTVTSADGFIIERRAASDIFPVFVEFETTDDIFAIQAAVANKRIEVAEFFE